MNNYNEIMEAQMLGIRNLRKDRISYLKVKDRTCKTIEEIF